MKLAFKINLLFTGILCCILLGMDVLIYNLSRENVHRDFRQRVKTRAARAAYLYGLFSTDTTNFLKSLDANTPPALFNKNIGIYDTTYKELYEFHDSTTAELKADTTWLAKAKDNGEYHISLGAKEVGVFYFPNALLVVVGAED